MAKKGLSEYDKLEMEFEQKVKKLQDSCPHKRLDKWCEIWWAPGHATNKSVKVCLRCNKRVMHSYFTKICQDCSEEVSWYSNTCLKCLSQNLKAYSIIKRDEKIIKRKEVK